MRYVLWPLGAALAVEATFAGSALGTLLGRGGAPVWVLSACTAAMLGGMALAFLAWTEAERCGR